MRCFKKELQPWQTGSDYVAQTISPRTQGQRPHKTHVKTEHVWLVLTKVKVICLAITWYWFIQEVIATTKTKKTKSTFSFWQFQDEALFSTLLTQCGSRFELWIAFTSDDKKCTKLPFLWRFCLWMPSHTNSTARQIAFGAAWHVQYVCHMQCSTWPGSAAFFSTLRAGLNGHSPLQTRTMVFKVLKVTLIESDACSLFTLL